MEQEEIRDKSSQTNQSEIEIASYNNMTEKIVHADNDKADKNPSLEKEDENHPDIKEVKLCPDDITVDNIISLLQIYNQEWQHRDELFWRQIFRYFYCTLIVIFLPNLTSVFNFELPEAISKSMYGIFPLFGGVLSLVFLYVSIAYSIRMKAASDVCIKIINQLPDNLKRKEIKKYPGGKFFSIQIAKLLSCAMFIGTFLLSILMMYLQSGDICCGN